MTPILEPSKKKNIGLRDRLQISLLNIDRI